MATRAESLAPRVERLENQYHEVTEKVHSLTVSQAESMMILETYMKQINAMNNTLLEVKDAIQKIQMPDKDAWQKEMDLINRLVNVEKSGRFTWNYALYGGLGTGLILILTWCGVSPDKIVEIISLLITKLL